MLDTLRGLTIVSMVAFHAMFDYVYVYGNEAPWFFEGIYQSVWRCSISWVFIALAGWMTMFSCNNAKRALKYAAAALVVYLATSVTRVSTPISFGIIYCMAACTLAYVLLSPVLERLPHLGMAVLFAALFLATLGVPSHTYAIEGFAWLGFPSAGFYSGDYYPLLPYVFLYLAGACASKAVSRSSYPVWTSRDLCRPLTFLGRHSLLVYLIHQPLLIAAFELALPV